MDIHLRLIPIVVRGFILGFLLLVFSSASFASQNKALVIGISQYTEINSLRYADADALEFSQILTDFASYQKSEVTVLLNQEATKKRIVDEINKIVQMSEKQPLGNFILLFAGHGIEGTLSANNMNEGAQNRETNIFLAPSDASIEAHNFYSTGKGKEVSNETFINKAWLARQLSAIKAKSIIIILDSCYSGTKSFGSLFLENEGYSVQNFGASSTKKWVADVQQRKLTLIKPANYSGGEQKKIAYFASSRDDQTSAEYDELQHGALSYSIFEYIKRIRRNVNEDARIDISVDDIYANIAKLFNETKVRGEPLAVAHQPLLIPIPDFANIKDMVFISVAGTRKKEIKGIENKNGILNLIADLTNIEIYVDGVKQDVAKAKMELPEGRHLIELNMPITGYRYTFTADILASSPVVKTLSMHGALAVESFWVRKGIKSPGPQLDVYIDGAHVGKSKLRLDKILVGTHLINVRYQNVMKSRHIEIRPGSPLLINYSIVLEDAPVVDESGVSNVVF